MASNYHYGHTAPSATAPSLTSQPFSCFICRATASPSIFTDPSSLYVHMMSHSVADLAMASVREQQNMHKLQQQLEGVIRESQKQQSMLHYYKYMIANGGGPLRQQLQYHYPQLLQHKQPLPQQQQQHHPSQRPCQNWIEHEQARRWNQQQHHVQESWEQRQPMVKRAFSELRNLLQPTMPPPPPPPVVVVTKKLSPEKAAAAANGSSSSSNNNQRFFTLTSSARRCGGTDDTFWCEMAKDLLGPPRPRYVAVNQLSRVDKNVIMLAPRVPFSHDYPAVAVRTKNGGYIKVRSEGAKMSSVSESKEIQTDLSINLSDDYVFYAKSTGSDTNLDFYMFPADDDIMVMADEGEEESEGEKQADDYVTPDLPTIAEPQVYEQTLVECLSPIPKTVHPHKNSNSTELEGEFLSERKSLDVLAKAAKYVGSRDQAKAISS